MPLVLISVAIVQKWLIIGKFCVLRVPLFSSYVQRMSIQFELEKVTRPLNKLFDGTPVINWIMSGFGVHIGSDVFIWDVKFMEHDLTHIGDGATLIGCILQTHLFEDRWLKTGPVVVGPSAMLCERSVMLYDSTLGVAASLGPLSLLMRGEKITHHARFFGLPSGPSTVPSRQQDQADKVETLHKVTELPMYKFIPGLQEMRMLEAYRSTCKKSLCRARLRLYDAINTFPTTGVDVDLVTKRQNELIECEVLFAEALALRIRKPAKKAGTYPSRQEKGMIKGSAVAVAIAEEDD